MTVWAKWLLVGIVSLAFGMVVLANAALASLAVTQLTGVLFAGAGLLQILGGITDRGMGNKLWNVILGVLMAVLGLSFVTNPTEGSVSLALLVTALLAVSGVLRMFLAWQMRHSRYFWSMLVTGSLSILLATLIFADFDSLSSALLGVILGIELVINGFALMVLSLFVRVLR